MAGIFAFRMFSRWTGGSEPRGQITNGPTLDGAPRPREITDGKRRRASTPENEDESPGKKRAKRESPPRIFSLPPSNSARRSGSVKALNLHDVNGRARPSHNISSQRSEVSFATGISRATSTGLSKPMERFKLQNSSPTPGPEGYTVSAPRAGVSQQSYNVAQPLGSSDMSLDTAVSSLNGGSRLSVQRGLTPTGATFGAMRTMLDSAMSNGSRTPSRSPTSMSKPIIERHASSGAWAGRSGSVKAPRFGDNSLSRGRTISLLSITSSAYASSNVSAGGEDRTTPTPTDGLPSPPSLASPSSSNTGSPPPNPKVKSLAAKRAIETLDTMDTPLRQSRSFTNRTPMRQVRVPMPHKKATSASFKSSDAGSSKHSHSQSESGAKSPVRSEASHRGHERTSSGPYANGRDQASGKRILDKRRAEEKDLAEGQRSPIGLADNAVMEEDDLHVEPIQKHTKGNTNPTDALMNGDNVSSVQTSKVAAAKIPPTRLAPISDSTSGTSSRTVGRSQLRVGREKTGHQHGHAPSASVTSASMSTASQAPPPSISTGRASSVAAPERRTRIPASEIPSKFNPTMNDRLNRAMSTGRFSLPPDEDDEDVGMTNATPGASSEKEKEKPKAPQMTGPPLNISDNMKVVDDREKTPEQDSSGAMPMNISPVKESYKRSDSTGSDMMSTTPTESSIRWGFSMTPITQEPPQAPALPSNPFAKVDTTPAVMPSGTPAAPPVPFGFAPLTPVPAAIPSIAPTEKPKPPSPFSFGSAPAPAIVAPTTSAQAAPAPASSGFSFLPAPGTTKLVATGSGFTSGFSFPPIVAQPAKAKAPSASPFSFGASPLPTIPTVSVSPPTEGIKEAPKPFSFGSMVSSASTPAVVVSETKPPPAPFSFGPPITTSMPVPSASLPASTTPSTPSPVKAGFSFPGTTPALNVSTTPKSSPFSFGSESPSPTKPLALGSALELKTPAKDNGFSFGAGPGGASTTPIATPTHSTGFSFGNAKSTTPAMTPSPAPFSFGASTSSAPSATPFTFGAAPAVSTTPAVTPIQTGGFTFSAPTGVNNPFASQSTPTTNKLFDFGSSVPAPSTTPSFSFGTPGDATPKGKHAASDSFGFGQPAPASNGFSFGAPAGGNPSTGAPGLVFPSGPTTPLTKVLELDSMDASPIRGGSPATNGSSFSAANNGSGFSFGASSSNGSGFGAVNTAAPAVGSGPSGFGTQSGSLFGSGFGKEASPSPSPSTFSFGGNAAASGNSGFGQAPASAPFGQPSSGFGQASGFSFSQPNSATSASPFNQAQALPSPALGGFAQLSSPAASPFSPSIGLGATNPFGSAQGQKRPSENQGIDAGSQVGGDGARRIAPMPKPRRARTQAETRNALAKAHGR